MTNYKYDVYICYSLKDEEKVKRICKLLDAAGISYYIERKDVLAGEEHSPAQPIMQSKLFLFVGSENSAGSSYARRELMFAADRKAEQVLVSLADDSSETAQLAGEMSLYGIRCLDSHTTTNAFISAIQGSLDGPSPERPVRMPGAEPPAAMPRDVECSPGAEPPASAPGAEPPVECMPCAAPPPAMSPDVGYRETATSYEPSYETRAEKPSFWNRLFGKKPDSVYSTIYAPAETKRGAHYIIQVYLHLLEQQDQIAAVAKEVQEDAVRRGSSKMLAYPLKRGDRVDIAVRVSAEKPLLCQKKSIVWAGQLTQCNFNCFIAAGLEADEIFCEAMLSVNGIPVGDMSFTTRIVTEPRRLHPEVLSRRYQKIFMSYAHQDIEKVRPYAHAYKVEGRDYFFDRHSLEAGDVYEEKIMNYINTSDLFLLFWSEHAAVSDYVKLEFQTAMKHAYPQVPFKDARLRICPMSIEPYAELPSELKDIYNFEEV